MGLVPALKAAALAGPVILFGIALFFRVLRRVPSSATFMLSLSFALFVVLPVFIGFVFARWMAAASPDWRASLKAAIVALPLFLAGCALTMVGAMYYEEDRWPASSGGFIIALCFVMTVVAPVVAGFAFRRWFSQRPPRWTVPFIATGLTAPLGYASGVILAAVWVEPETPGNLLMHAAYWVVLTMVPVAAWLASRHWLALRAVRDGLRFPAAVAGVFGTVVVAFAADSMFSSPLTDEGEAGSAPATEEPSSATSQGSEPSRSSDLDGGPLKGRVPNAEGASATSATAPPTAAVPIVGATAPAAAVPAGQVPSKQYPARTVPRPDRAGCLRQCVASCNEDSMCERECVARNCR